MTDNKSFSLQDQIKKRKTQEMMRSIEANKAARATGTLPAVPAATSVEVKPASPSPATVQTKPLSASGTLTRSQVPARSSDPRRTTQLAAIPVAARQTQQAKAVGSSISRARIILSRRQSQLLIVAIT